ncbi:MAG TPA: Xaa-Pro peptidase family protein [Acidimicrobiia bacterium]|nr:Xaa-Pro peptidase family protein [Acidimicrobiia bacterium]
MFPDFDYAARLERTRDRLRRAGVDALLVSVGADLPYLIGYEAMPLERLTMLVLPSDGEPTLLVPMLEAARVDDRRGAFAVRAWGETEDPVALTAELVGSRSSLLVGDQTWSVFLLALQGRLGAARFDPATSFMADLRMRKEPSEIECLRAAGAAVDRVIAGLGDIRFEGRAEREVAGDIAERVVAEGHDMSTFTIVASGPNAASPHHETGRRVIEAGDSIVLDFGGRYRGYHSDTTRTLHMGEPSVKFAAAYTVLEQAQAAAREAVRPGVAAQEVDRVARRVIDDAGYGDRFIHRTGHGIGLEVHEHPYLVEGNEAPLEEGMTFSIEPGIYEPGAYGMRIEDIVVCTADGIDELNRSPRALLLVE